MATCPTEEASCVPEGKSLAAAITAALDSASNLQTPHALPRSRAARATRDLRISHATSANLSQLFGEAPETPDSVHAIRGNEHVSVRTGALVPELIVVVPQETVECAAVAARELTATWKATATSGRLRVARKTAETLLKRQNPKEQRIWRTPWGGGMASLLSGKRNRPATAAPTLPGDSFAAENMGQRCSPSPGRFARRKRFGAQHSPRRVAEIERLSQSPRAPLP